MKNLIDKKLTIPFALVTVLFFAWGLAGAMTEPLLTAFKSIYTNMSTFEASFVQSAFYGAYFVWGIPAAFLIKKTSYKSAILLGLVLYTLGAFLFVPASSTQVFYLFLLALFVLATGISFLETAANPYIIAMGDEKTAIQRLNLAQSFFPFGNLIGVLLATQVILSKLSSDADKQGLTENALAELQTKELGIVAQPYIYIAIIMIIFLLIFFKTKMPNYKDEETSEPFFTIFMRNFSKKQYCLSVLALFCAMLAQFGTFAFSIPYLMENFVNSEGELISKGNAGFMVTCAAALFMLMRFVCTGLMSCIKPAKLLAIMSAIGTVCTIIAITCPSNFGSYALLAVFGCVSLLFPTIYGLGLNGLSIEETKVGASGLIMTIIAVGIMNPVQGFFIDKYTVHQSFLCTVIPFIILVAYGLIIDNYSKQAES